MRFNLAFEELNKTKKTFMNYLRIKTEECKLYVGSIFSTPRRNFEKH